MDQTILTSKWNTLNPLLDERARRLWAATEAVAIGRSGVTLVADVTGLSRTTIHAGIKELKDIQEGEVPVPEQGDRLRAVGSGRKRLAVKDGTLIGEFKNGGEEWPPKGKPEHVSDHDFPDPKVAKAVPYGVYGVGANLGGVTVGTDHEPPEFAVDSIRTWWEQMGRPMYPEATRLMVTADCGGSNGYRSRAWKLHLQKLADDTHLEISVCHFPPGTSKWNKIEHRMFCHITQNWRGRPLVSLEVVVNLIGSATTRNGLKIRASLDSGKHELGGKVKDHELALARLKPSDFQGAWNYAILPR